MYLAWHIAALALIAAITAGLALVAAHVSSHETVRIGSEADRIYITDGFYKPETTPEHGIYRWAQPYAQIVLPNWGPGRIHVSISGTGAGSVSSAAVLYIDATAVSTTTTQPGQPWTVEAWGTTGDRDPHIALGGPQLDAPGDGRTLGRLVQSLDIYAPDARSDALLNLGLLALTSLLLYLCLLYWTMKPGLALVCSLSVPMLYGPLVVFRDRWMDTVVWVAPIVLAALIFYNGYTRRKVPKSSAESPDISNLAPDLLHPAPIPIRQSPWPTIAAIAALTAALILLATGYIVDYDSKVVHFNAFDAERMYQVSAGLGEYGLPTRYPGHDTWTKYGFGQPLIAVPFYYLGKLGVALGGTFDAITRFTVSFTNLLVTSLTCWLLYRASRRFATTGVSLMVVATFLLTTPALNYARTFFSEPAGALLLLAAILLILPTEAHPNPTAKNVLMAGLLMGATILFKPAFAEYIPAVGLGVLWLAFQSSGFKVQGSTPTIQDKVAIEELKKPEIPYSKVKTRNWFFPVLKRGALFSIGPILGGIIQIGYNYLRYYDTPNPFFRSGYEHEPGFSTPLLEGLGGLLFSPGKSIFLYAPVVLLAPVGLWLMYRQGGVAGKLAVALITASTVASFVFNGMWWAWTGNFAWGPRLIMPVLPLLVWPLASLGAWITHSNIVKKAKRLSLARVMLGVWIGLATLGALVSIPGALVDFQVYYRLRGLLEAGQPGEAPTIYDPAQSPLLVEPGYLLDGLTAAIYRPSLHQAGMPEAWDVLVPGALVIVAVGGVGLATRRIERLEVRS